MTAKRDVHADPAIPAETKLKFFYYQTNAKTEPTGKNRPLEIMSHEKLMLYCRDSSHYCLLHLRVSRRFVQKPLVGCQKFANETHVIIVGRSFDARFISLMSF